MAWIQQVLILIARYPNVKASVSRDMINDVDGIIVA